MKKTVNLTITGTIVTEGDLVTLLSNYAEKLRLRRKAKNLTLAQVAEASGLTTSAVARVERGERVPGIDTVLKIEKVLGGKDDDTG